VRGGSILSPERSRGAKLASRGTCGVGLTWPLDFARGWGLVLVLFMLFASTASALTIEQYVAALEQINGSLAAKQLTLAQTEARTLLGTKITWSKGTFAADASVLQPILEARTADGAHRARLASTIVELRRAAGMEATRANKKLLEQIAAEQEPPALPKGGEIKTKIEKDIPLLERIADAIADGLAWLRDKLRDFLRWLLDFLPRPREGAAGGALMQWIIYGIVAAIVVIVIVLAVGVIRRSRAGAPDDVTTSAPLGSRADEDPLSRGATEWERYANELANAERFREAIRAWYHAVLVTCYAAGILHFRKGRTNWEYLATLPPTLTWRPDLIELTRRFEREWYGSLQSTEDAYADCSERAQQILDALRRELRGAA
jgi:uncharacterized membrane protein